MRDYSTPPLPEQDDLARLVRPTPAEQVPPAMPEQAPPAVPRSSFDVRAVAEAALLLDVTVLLTLLQAFVPIPIFQSFVALAALTPFVLLTLRRGARVGLVATAAAFILLACFVGPLFATAALVFGGLGTLFGWASRRHIRPSVTIVVGAALYGLLYLLLPFLLGLAALRINLARTLHDVHKQAGSFLAGLGHLHLLGVPITGPLVSALSSFGPGRALLDALHGIALAGLTHPLATLVVVFALYSLVHVWAYFVVSRELYRHLPREARRDPEGREIDYFSVR